MFFELGLIYFSGIFFDGIHVLLKDFDAVAFGDVDMNHVFSELEIAEVVLGGSGGAGVDFGPVLLAAVVFDGGVELFGLSLA
jgi:hypothetical protein